MKNKKWKKINNEGKNKKNLKLKDIKSKIEYLKN